MKLLITNSTQIFILVLILMLGGIGCTPHFQYRNDIPLAYEGKYIGVGDMNIRFHQSGRGPDLLFIHGSPGSIEDFQSLEFALSKNYRVTRYDRPGQGFSSVSEVPYTLTHNAEIALGLIDKLELSDVIVVGHSYGGATALKMATLQPESVKAFVIMGAPVVIKERPDSFYYLLGAPLIGKGIVSLSSISGDFIGKAKLKKDLAEAFSPNEEYLTSEFVEKRQAIWLQPTVSLAIAKERLRIKADLISLENDYQKIRHPLFILHGENDKTVHYSQGQAIKQKIPDAELAILPNTGHYVQYARPELIKALVDRISSTAHQKTALSE